MTGPMSDVKIVDLSIALGKLFDPSEDTLKIMREIQSQTPTPIDELRRDH